MREVYIMRRGLQEGPKAFGPDSQYSYSIMYIITSIMVPDF